MVRIGARVFVFLPDDEVFSPNVVGTVTDPPDEHGRYMVRADGGAVYQCTAEMIRVLGEPDDVMATIVWHLGQLRERAAEEERLHAQDVFMHLHAAMEAEGIDGTRIFDLAIERMDAASKRPDKDEEAPSD